MVRAHDRCAAPALPAGNGSAELRDLPALRTPWPACQGRRRPRGGPYAPVRGACVQTGPAGVPGDCWAIYPG